MGIDKKVLKQGIKEIEHVNNIIAIRCACHTKIGDLKATCIKSDEPIKFENLDFNKFEHISKWSTWAKKYGCAWFHFTGKVKEKAKGKHVVVRLKLQGEGLVFNPDGFIVQGVTQVMSKGDVFHSLIAKQVIDISHNSTGNEDIDFYVDAGFNGKLRFEHLKAHLRRFDICIEHDDVIQYYYDYEDLFFVMMKLDYKSERYKEISKMLKQSFRIYKKQGAQAARDFLKPNYYKKGDYPDTTLYSIGHGHIDLAWLWPIRETKRKIARTFANQLRNIDIYDGYIFAESQPQMFKWLKEEYPDLYNRVKEKVKENRIELQGANWVEGDCNLTGGESWIRQSLYGSKFWKEEFDFKSNMCWLPDVFGFPATLPQVLKKCGMDYFMTIKLISNTVNQFPYKSFNWEGLDGTQVLAHMEPQGDYNSGSTVFALHRSDKRNTERDILDKALLIYGDGDGGGGPGEGHIEFTKRHSNVCKMSKAVDFFNDVNPIKDILPTHKGELYYERHQGCYTSQANSKKWNRRIEEQLHKVEWIGAYAFLKGISYDKNKLDDIWKEVLLYQFHDILPGSSIKRVYDESIARYKTMYQELVEMENNLINAISKSNSLYAINPINYDRCEYIKEDSTWYKTSVKKYSTAELIPLNEDVSSLSFDDNSIQNSCVKVTFDNKTGVITSIVDKAASKELVKDYFNKFTIYSDPFMFYNAWDINMDYPNMEKWDLELEGTKCYIDGPTVIRESKYKYNKSHIIQKVILTLNESLIKFDTIVDWHEELKMLRADFVPTVYNDNVKCNIQFGNFDRTTREDDSVQKAQFEICAHKFVNLDQDGYGFALLNNCKYGHRVKNGFLSLALLRAPKFPDPTCDRGVHHFVYAIYPHNCKFEDSDTMKLGYCLNNELEVTKKEINIPTMVEFEDSSIVIETIKISENNNGIIVRAYEPYGNTINTKLNTSIDFAESYETDMLENILNKIDLNKLTFKPFEIKTIFLSK